MRNSKGFTLLELMVAVGLIGVVSFGVMVLTKNIHKTSKSSQQALEKNQALTSLFNHLNKDKSCQETFKGLSPHGNGSLVPVLKYVSPNGNVREAFEADEAIGTGASRIYLKKMAIKGYEPKTQMAKFEVVFNKGSKDIDTLSKEEKAELRKSTLGGIVSTTSIDIQVILDSNGKIKSCSRNIEQFVGDSCSAFLGDFSDLQNCKSITIKTLQPAPEPAIKTSGDLFTWGELKVGSYAGGVDGDVQIGGDMETTKSIIFKDKAALAPGNGTNEIMLKGTTDSNHGKLILGSQAVLESTGSTVSLGVSSNNISLNTKSTVDDDATFKKGINLPSGAKIEFNGNRLIISGLAVEIVGKNDFWKPSGELDLMATRDWVYQALAKMLDKQNFHNSMLNNLSSIESNPVLELWRQMCETMSGHSWNSGQNRCVFDKNDQCGGNQALRGFSNGNNVCLALPTPP